MLFIYLYYININFVQTLASKTRIFQTEFHVFQRIHRVHTLACLTSSWIREVSIFDFHVELSKIFGDFELYGILIFLKFAQESHQEVIS